MAALVYILCAVTSLLCMLLLGRAYWRTGARLLLWSAICFVGLALNNLLVFIDLVVLQTQVDLQTARLLATFVGISVLLTALVWESER
jgi:hypothetical protein